MKPLANANARRALRYCGLLAVLLWNALPTSPAHAVTQLKPSADAPEITLKDVTGTEVSTAKLKGKVVVVMFGELYHEKTQDAAAQLEKILQDPRLRDQGIVPLLVTTKEGKPDDVKTDPPQKLTLIQVLRDPERKAFGAYQVVVMPSVVVIDKEGKVIVAVAGMVPRFSDMATDALLFGTGKLSAAQYKQSLDPQTQPGAAVTDTAVQAARLASLAQQLARRGLDDMASEKFVEALKLDPHSVAGHLAFGTLELKRGHLAQAETQFKAVLEDQPKSTEAILGLAYVQTSRGGAELDLAETAVHGVLATSPTSPRAHYLMGLINQQRKKPDEAAASFKKAAELLLERSPEETAP